MEYQNIFTQVQVRGPLEAGIPAETNSPEIYDRGAGAFFNYWVGKLGNAQLGPIYLGSLGVFSLVFGVLSINIMGLNYLASVDWSVGEFIRQLFWLSLDPPGPEWGLSLTVPLNQGGWWLIASFFLLVSVMLWWVRCYVRAIQLGMGT
ncbi:MAG: photosynthetic reaction center subunit M, partial [Pseudomonadota bacterium]